MEELHNIIERDQEYSDAMTQRTIIDLIDVETGDCVDAGMLDTMTEAELTKLKELQSIAKNSGKHKYVCAICGQPLRLDSRQYASRKYKSYFFSHYSSGDDCPLKSSSDSVDPIKSTINWYGRFKESQIHKDMCRVLQEILTGDVRFSCIETYPTINIYGMNVHWHKPDVSASFYGNQLVFETLMYNSFISRIVEKDSFYRLANMYLLWIFPYFSVDNQAMHEKDVYYTHKRNIFVFDSASYYRTGNDSDTQKPVLPKFIEEGYQFAQEESLKQKRLMLNCYWQIPVIKDGQVKIEWHRKLVGIEELTYDAIKKEVFFHNSDYDFKEIADPEKRKLIEDWERAKEDRWVNVLHGVEERRKQYEISNAKKILQEKKLEIVSRVDSGELVPEPYEENGKYGYKVDDVEFIKPQYQKAFPFRNGVAIVIKKKKWGLINYSNTPVIDNVYEKISWADIEKPMLLWVKRSEHRWFLCNNKGEDLLGFDLYWIKKVYDYFIILNYEDKRYGLLSSDGTILISPHYDKIVADDDTHFSLVLAGNTIQVSTDSIDVPLKQHSEILPNLYLTERLMVYGITDCNNNIVLPFEYNKISKLSDKYLLVGKRVGRTTFNRDKLVFAYETLYALFDKELQLCLPFAKGEIKLLSNGCIFRDNIVYDKELKAKLQGFSSIEVCPDGNIILQKTNTSGWGWSLRKETYYGLANTQAQLIFPLVGKRIVKNADGNIEINTVELHNGAVIKTCFGISCLFESGETSSIKDSFDRIEVLASGNILVERNGSFGLLSQDGSYIMPCKYERSDFEADGSIKLEVFPLDSLCSKIHSLKKYALSDIAGNRLTECKFDSIDILSTGLYIAIKEKFSQLLDSSGNQIVEERINQFFQVISDSAILVTRGSLHGIIALNGNVIIPIEYNEITSLPTGCFKVSKTIEYNQLFGIFDAYGNSIVDCKYSEICTDEAGNIIPTYKPLDTDFYIARLYDKYALANKEKVLITDYLYEAIVKFSDNYFIGKSGNYRFLIGNKGDILLKIEGKEIIDIIDRDRFIVKNADLMGAVRADGSEIIPCKYQDIVRLTNHTWKVKQSNLGDSRYGLLADNGDIIYDCRFRELVIDSSGIVVPTYIPNMNTPYAARKFDKYALCSEDKTILTDYIFDSISCLNDGFYLGKKEQEQIVLNGLGGIVFSSREFNIISVIDSNRFIVNKGAERGVISASGQLLIQCQYWTINLLGNGYYIGRRNVESAFMSRYENDLFDEKGNYLFSSDKNIELDDNSYPIVKVKMKNDESFVMECSGKFAVAKTSDISLKDYVYDSVDLLTKSIYVVQKGNDYGLLSIDGKEILPVEYSNNFTLFSNGIIQFRNHEHHCGLCNSVGRIIEEPKFDFIRENSPGNLKLFWTEGYEKKSKFIYLGERKKFKKDTQYSGIVCGIKPFGIFVKVNGYGSGLVHINQLMDQGKNISLYSQGDRVTVKVIRIRRDGKVEFSIL